MLKLLVVTNLFLASMGGVTYGEAPNAERVPPATKGQAARQVEKIPAERKAEDSEKTKGTEGGRVTNDTDQPGISKHSRRITAIELKQGPVQGRLGSRKESSRNLPPADQGTAESNKAAAEDNRSHDDNHSGFNAYGYLGAFSITAYTAGYESTQKKKGEPGYGITATGTTVKEGRTIAADWSVLPPGTVVKIEGLDGTYTVEDKGGGVKGNHIDLYIADLNRALEWGRQQRSVWVVKWGLEK